MSDYGLGALTLPVIVPAVFYYQLEDPAGGLI